VTDTALLDWVPDGNIAVHLFASGIIEHFDAAQAPEPFRLPYPASLQMALDRLTLLCWRQTVAPPSGVVELLSWASAPFGDWKLDLAGVDVDPDESLVRYGRPSTTCEELGTLRGDIEGEIRENALIRAVMDKARAANAPQSYVAFRRLLIEQPAITALALDEKLTLPELAILADEVRQAYIEAPPEATADGIVRTCAGCHGLRLPLDDDRTWYCDDPTCPAPAKPGPDHPAAEGMWWLRRELRTYIVTPGRAELRIADMIGSTGVPVQLWPDYDACDLAVFDDRPWAADVKAWRNPNRLARHLKARRFTVPADAERAFIVIAREQLKGQPDYLKRLHKACPEVRPGQPIVAVSEADFLGHIQRRLAGQA
jgi:hypothetical protein